MSRMQAGTIPTAASPVYPSPLPMAEGVTTNGGRSWTAIATVTGNPGHTTGNDASDRNITFAP